MVKMDTTLLVFTFISIVGWIAVFLILRQKSALQTMLQEGARGYESLRSFAKRLQEENSSLQSAAKENFRREEVLRQALNSANQRTEEADKRLAAKTKDFERRIHDVERQRDHILQQYELVTAREEELHRQLTDLTTARQEVEGEQMKLMREVQKKQENTAEKLQEDNSRLRQTVGRLEQELQAFRERKITPRDFDTLKRKIGQYELLYNSMKGQRDMVDERNRNWEDALRIFANWILKESPVAILKDDAIFSKGLGPLVGEALDRIGSSLVAADPAAEVAAEKEAMSSVGH